MGRHPSDTGQGAGVARLTRLWRRWRRRAPMPGGGATATAGTDVDRYWAEFTVYARPFPSPEASLEYLDWRFRQYPLFRELMQLYGNRAGETVLDYGCGPGNDVVGYLVLGHANKVIGVDISEKALSLAANRLRLHGVDARAELIRIADGEGIPLPDGAVDHVYSEGVLHHTTNPAAIVRELHRVLKPGGDASVMVYNRNSVWFHLHAAYVKKVLEGAYRGMTIEEAFARTTDGEECPIARPYRPADFGALLADAGFTWEYAGGYLSLHELEILSRHRHAAERDRRLPAEHRDFLASLTDDGQGYPTYRGKYAGIGGVYHLRKPR